MAEEEKTEQATPKKKEDAVKEGQVGKSKEVPSVLVLLSSLMLLFFWGPELGKSLMEAMRTCFIEAANFHMENQDRAVTFLTTIAFKVELMLLPVFAVAVLAALLGNYIQIGFLISTKAIMPKLSKLDPIKGVKKLFSIQSLAELVKNILKIIIICSVAYWTIKGEIHRIFPMVQMEVLDISAIITSVALKIAFRITLVLIILAILDYAFQKWKYEKDLRMSHQEVKDELKQREGDPLVKSRIRSVQREMAKKRMMSAVPEADVVITNPLRLAVALEYLREKMSAPKVTAKGAGLVAEKIREIATENNIPLVEDKPLARSLYRDVEIGREIPATLYQAVAGVLSYVYRLKGKVGA